MNFEIQRQQGCCVFNLNCEELSKEHIKTLECYMREYLKNKRRNAKFALNFSNIKKVHESFFEFVKSNNFSIFGPDSNILTYLSLRKTINIIPIFWDINDFIKNKRRIIKREFKIV